eukprot:4921081-Amphidinium_carterae.1
MLHKQVLDDCPCSARKVKRIAHVPSAQPRERTTGMHFVAWVIEGLSPSSVFRGADETHEYCLPLHKQRSLGYGSKQVNRHPSGAGKQTNSSYTTDCKSASQHGEHIDGYEMQGSSDVKTVRQEVVLRTDAACR